ncbi:MULTISPECIES: pyridoxamine 5'-phosphate oxidase family protein [Actinomadura]|uniref:pyridoxamine 5'-phosphate oxidase family protein n=1 Tax=Actinomadura TaxID=1988 RepID=UPI0003AD1B7E|nr:pyridoxamine 5'-phosphate oxidase family protein [Actinomadura madurae]
MHADEELASIPVPRSLVGRRAYARDRLESGFQMWLATGSDGHGAHLIPVAYVWDGSALYTATFAKSRTVANINAHPQARVALGTTADVVMIDTGASLMDVPDIEPDIAERYARVSTDPRTHPEGTFIYLRLQPRRILVWNGFHEFVGRTVMRDGRWLDNPVD